MSYNGSKYDDKSCPVCGAAVERQTASMTRYACGKVSDDGPGEPCPNAPKREPVEEAAPVAAEPARPQFALEVAPINEIAEIEKIRDGINRYMGAEIENEAKALLASAEGVTVAGHLDGPKAGREAVHGTYMRFVKFRTQLVESAHQTYKAPINALAKLLDGRKADLLRMTAEREASLKADRDAFDKLEADRKAAEAAALAAEKARKEAEAAAEQKRILQTRIQRVMDLGATPNVIELAGATEAEFEAIVAAAAEAQAVKLAQQEDERQERERLAAEQRARTELIEARTGEASRAGILPWWTGLDALASMSDDEFRGELVERIEAKALADQDAERVRVEREAAAAVSAANAAELERLRKEAADRADEDRRLAKIEEDRQAAEAQRIADEARAASEAARIEAERPDREKVLAWLDRVEFEVIVTGPGHLESSAIHDQFDGHQMILINAIQAAKREFQA